MTTNIDKRLISLSRRYSDAILDIAKEKNELDNVFSDLKNVVTVYDYSDEMREFLAHPAISHKDKKELIQSVFEGKISTVTLNLLYTLVDKNKFNLIDTILYCYENSLNEAKNILKSDKYTVKSSNYALEFYKKLGFVQLFNDIQIENGVHFHYMIY